MGYLYLYYLQAGGDRLVAEATLYCGAVWRDVLSGRRLRRRYPGRIYPLMYDDVARDLRGHTADVYRFVDEPIPTETLDWIGRNARRKRNGTSISTRWKDKLTVGQNERISAACSQLLTLLRPPRAQ